jgi:hypothetical protein
MISRALAAMAFLSSCGGASGLSVEKATEPAPDAAASVGQGDAAQSEEGTDSSPSDDATTPVGDACAESVLSYVPPTSNAACWACVKTACQSQVTQCAADCTCNDTVTKLLECIDQGEAAPLCFLPAFNSAGDNAQTAVQNCFMTAYQAQCGVCATTSGAVPDAATAEASPPAGDGASAACTPTGGGGGFGNGECEQDWGKMCGGTNYQVDCACPRGSCVCFGSTTFVIPYAGCPSCPSATASENAIFALCGFPYPQ